MAKQLFEVVLIERGVKETVHEKGTEDEVIAGVDLYLADNIEQAKSIALLDNAVQIEHPERLEVVARPFRG